MAARYWAQVCARAETISRDEKLLATRNEVLKAISETCRTMPSLGATVWAAALERYVRGWEWWKAVEYSRRRHKVGKMAVVLMAVMLAAGAVSAQEYRDLRVIPLYDPLTQVVTETVRVAPAGEPSTGMVATVSVTLTYTFTANCHYYHFWPPHFSFVDTEEKCRASAAYESMHGMEGWVQKAYRQIAHEVVVAIAPAPQQAEW